VSFVVVDDGYSIEVGYSGAPPQLFRDNIGVVVEGSWAGDHFGADTLIIKHDEEYRSVDGKEPYVPPTETTG
jgi:cytochrome c-type biogenesis protein CcmE